MKSHRRNPKSPDSASPGKAGVPKRSGNSPSGRNAKHPADTSEVSTSGPVQGDTPASHDTDELLHSKPFLQATLDALSSHIAILDQHGTIVKVNAPWIAFAKKNGFRGSSLGLGANYLEVCDSAAGSFTAEAPAVAAGIRSVMAGHTHEFQLEYPCHSPTEQRWFVVRVTRFNGQAPALVVVAHETITERKRAELQLENSVSMLHATLEATVDGILVVDDHGRVVTYNQKFAEMWHIAPEILASGDRDQIVGCVKAQLKDPDRFTQVIRVSYADLDAETFDVFEFKDGRIFERYSKPQRVHGVAVGRVSGFRDITERRRSEEMLRVQASALDAVANAIVIADSDGIIRSVNPAFTALTGYSAQEAVGQNPRILKSGRQDEAFYRDLWQTITSGQVWRGELVNRRKDGSLYTEEMSIAPMRDAEGRIARYIAVKQDITQRKQAAEALQVSEERFRNLIENTSDWVWEIDDQGRYTYASPRVFDLLGYRPEEALGKTPFDFMPPEEAARVGALLMEAIAVRKPIFSLENTNRHKDGRSVVLESSGVPIFDNHGEWRGYRGIDRDITERKRVEEALKLTEERFSELAANIADVFWVTDPTMSKILYVSPAFETVWGRPCQNAYENPNNYLDGIHPDDLPGVLTALDGLLPNGTFHHEYRVVRPDGSIRWVLDRGYPIKNEKGEVVRLVGIVQDITERRLAEEAQRHSEQRFRTLIETARDVIFAMSPEGVITSINPEFFKATGSRQEEVVGHRFDGLVAPEDLPQSQALFARALAGEALPPFELRLKRRGGPPVSFEFAVATRAENGQVVEFLGIGRDITERAKAEESLRLLGAAVEQAKESIIVMDGVTDRRIPKILFVNPAFTQLTGYSADEVVGRTPDLFHGPHTDPALIAGIADHVAKGEPFTGDGINYRKDGTEFEVELNIAPIRDSLGVTTHMVVIQHDITERKRDLALVREGRERLDLALDAAEMGVWEWDLRSNRIAWSPECYKILGVAGCDGTLDAFTNVVHRDDVDRILRSMEETLARRERFTADFRIVHPGGQIRWVTNVGRGNYDDQGHPLRVVGTIQDITERKRAEEELSAKTALLEAQVDASIDGLLFVDNEGKKVIQNDRFIELLKVPADIAADIHDQSLLRFVVDQMKYPDAFLEKVRHLYAHPNVSSRDELELKNGMALDRYSAPVIGKDGRNYGRIWGFRDITDRKQAEADLEKSHQELVDLSRQAGMAEVATGVLHNVGNVLNSVNVSATLVADHVRHSQTTNVARVAALLVEHQTNLAAFLTADPQGQMIPAYLSTLADSLADEQKTLLSETDQLRENIEHIKDIVAMQQTYARTSGIIETVSVPDLVEDALRINAGALSRHEVKTIRDYQSRPAIATDKHKVMLILINLVRNAKYACDESGRAEKEITVRVTGDENGAQIIISDNGVGIPAQNLTQIFSHGFTTRKEGHGFGLHSSALAARELGGSLTVQSEGIGRGATFILNLPRKPEYPNHEHPVL